MTSRAKGLYNAAGYALVRQLGPGVARRRDFPALLHARARALRRATGGRAYMDDETLDRLVPPEGLGELGELGGWFSSLIRHAFVKPLQHAAHAIAEPARRTFQAIGWERGAHYVDRWEQIHRRDAEIGGAILPAVALGFLTGGPIGAIVNGVIALVQEIVRRRQALADKNAYRKLARELAQLEAQARTEMIALVAADLTARRTQAQDDAAKAMLVEYGRKLETYLNAHPDDDLADAAGWILAEELRAAGNTADQQTLADDLAEQLRSGKLASEVAPTAAPPPANNPPPATDPPPAGTMPPALPTWAKVAIGAAIVAALGS